MRISDWSSDVCSSDLAVQVPAAIERGAIVARRLRTDAFEQRRVALHISGRRRPAMAPLGVEVAEETPAPHLVHPTETRRAVAEDSGAVPVFGRQLMEERRAIPSEGVDMQPALPDRELHERGGD